MKKYLLLILIGCIGFQFSCKTKKRETKTMLEPVGQVNADFLMENLIKKQVKADYLNSKIKLGIEGDKVMNISLSGTLRMEKDKAIWISLKKFGFEVARALITPDSVYLVDRVQGNNVAEDISFVQRQMNLPANFQMLQSIVLGNPVFFTKTHDFKVDSMGYQLISETSDPKSRYFLNGSDLSLRQMNFDEPAQQREMLIHQDDYKEEAGNQNFSFLRNIMVKSRESGNMNLKLQFSNVEFDVPKSMPFNKPKVN